MTQAGSYENEEESGAGLYFPFCATFRHSNDLLRTARPLQK